MITASGYEAPKKFKIGFPPDVWDECCWVLGLDVINEVKDLEPIGFGCRVWRWNPSNSLEKEKTVDTKFYKLEVDLGDIGEAGGGHYLIPLEIGIYREKPVVWVGDVLKIR